MQQKNKTLLMSDGRCEEAMDFCVSRFPDAAVTNIRRYGSGAEGSVERASLSFRGRPSWRSISPLKHGFRSTPALRWYADRTKVA